MTQTSKYQMIFKKIFVQISNIGKSLLFPIATLPIAALLLRIGVQIPTKTEFSSFINTIMVSGGTVIFDNLPIIFAIGIAFGLAKDNRGEAALAGFIGMSLVMILIKQSGGDLAHKIYQHSSVDFHTMFGSKYDSLMANNVLTGIIAGSIVAYIYNKFNGTKLPSVLGFFSGRRLIPVMTILVIMIFGIFYAIVFPWIGYCLQELSEALSKGQGNRWSNASIMLGYGLINRLLIPFGMHHIPNTIFWFQLGEHKDTLGNIVNGDINIFLSGIPENNTAGTFQSGFFPIMMFGLPALAAVFYYTADDKIQRNRVLSIFGSAALVSFLTGITEPLEFAFLFASPILFGVHALLTGIFGFITGVFGIQLGFGFSAGLFDYLLSIPKSMDIIHANKTGFDAVMANPAWIWVIGAGAAATYFFIGKFLINKFNLNTPGRGKAKILASDDNSTQVDTSGKMSIKSRNIVIGFGGWDNITKFANCATRLRYDVKDSSKIDEKLLKDNGVMGVIKVSKTHVQAIIGPTVEILNDEIIAHKGTKLK